MYMILLILFFIEISCILWVSDASWNSVKTCIFPREKERETLDEKTDPVGSIYSKYYDEVSKRSKIAWRTSFLLLGVHLKCVSCVYVFCLLASKEHESYNNEVVVAQYLYILGRVSLRLWCHLLLVQFCLFGVWSFMCVLCVKTRQGTTNSFSLWSFSRKKKTSYFFQLQRSFFKSTVSFWFFVVFGHLLRNAVDKAWHF